MPEQLKLLGRAMFSPLVFVVAIFLYGPSLGIGMTLDYIWLGPWED